MKYLFVKGTFHVNGKRPDGDTISFCPAEPGDLTRLKHTGIPRFNSNFEVSLRFEGIDALETHYTPEFWFQEFHQPLEFAEAARDRMLALLGMPTRPENWSDNGTARNVVDGVEGIIATREVDAFQRVVAFVFPETVGEMVEIGAYNAVDASIIAESVNYKLLAEGLVYPIFYATFPYEIREEWAELAARLREKGVGLWGQDQSNEGFSISGKNILSQLETRLVVYPKLFRRLVSFLAQRPNIRAFYPYLHALPDLAVYRPNCLIGPLAKFFSFDKKTGFLKMRYLPEEMVFLPRSWS